MRLSLSKSEIQTILNALDEETIHYAVTLRAKIREKVRIEIENNKNKENK
jgi:hypothetical protein